MLDRTVVNWMIVFNEVKRFRLCSLRAFSTRLLQQQFNEEHYVGFALKGRLTKQKNDTYIPECKCERLSVCRVAEAHHHERTPAEHNGLQELEERKRGNRAKPLRVSPLLF